MIKNVWKKAHEIEYEKREKRILEKNKEYFTRLKDKSIGKLKKYRCQKCHENFETTAEAMCRHTDTHKSGGFIKIHKKSLKNGVVIRPYEHFWSHQLQQYVKHQSRIICS